MIETAEQAMAQMLTLSDVLSDAVSQLRGAGEARADAQVIYEAAYSKTLLSSDQSSADKRKAEATVATVDTWTTLLRAEVVEDYCKRRISAAQSTLSALMTATSALRQEARLAN